jgi:hypothetical protein
MPSRVAGDTDALGRAGDCAPLRPARSSSGACAWRPGQRFEAIADMALPAWKIRSELALLSSPTFGAQAATDVLHQMIGDGPSDARQVALATFDRYGFKAAAITTFAVAASAMATRPRPVLSEPPMSA